MDVLLVSNVCLFKTCDVYFFFNEKEAVPALLNNSVRQLLLFWEVSDTGRNFAPLKMLNLFLWWWNNIMNTDEEFLQILKRCLTFVNKWTIAVLRIQRRTLCFNRTSLTEVWTREKGLGVHSCLHDRGNDGSDIYLLMPSLQCWSQDIFFKPSIGDGKTTYSIFVIVMVDMYFWLIL